MGLEVGVLERTAPKMYVLPRHIADAILFIHTCPQRRAGERRDAGQLLIGRIERDQVVQVLHHIRMVVEVEAAHPGAHGADADAMELREHLLSVGAFPLFVAVLTGEFRFDPDEDGPDPGFGKRVPAILVGVASDEVDRAEREPV